jgi:hypothetical protein
MDLRHAHEPGSSWNASGRPGLLMNLGKLEAGSVPLGRFQRGTLDSNLETLGASPASA